MVAPLNGSTVIEVITVIGGSGLFDRLISDNHTRTGLEILTLDPIMATLPDT